MTTNPLLEKWSGHYNGVPPFDKIKVEQFVPAFEAAMSEKQKEIDAIANNTHNLILQTPWMLWNAQDKRCIIWKQFMVYGLPTWDHQKWIKCRKL